MLTVQDVRPRDGRQDRDRVRSGGPRRGTSLSIPWSWGWLTAARCREEPLLEGERVSESGWSRA